MDEAFTFVSDKGAHFFRRDFQVHSPRDRQWKGSARVSDEERTAYGSSLINACRDKGLNAIAITDHHDMAFVRYVRQAAAQETDAEDKHNSNPLFHQLTRAFFSSSESDEAKRTERLRFRQLLQNFEWITYWIEH